MYSSEHACFKHSNFFKVKVLDPQTHPVKSTLVPQKELKTWLKIEATSNAPESAHQQIPTRQAWHSTTSFLTATTLIYAIGAGITAAAGHNKINQIPVFKASLGHFLPEHRLTANLRNSAP